MKLKKRLIGLLTAAVMTFGAVALASADYSARLIHFTRDGSAGAPALAPDFFHHSCWSGIGASSLGHIYIGVSNHRQPVSPGDPEGDVLLYKWDAAAGRMHLLGSVRQVSTAAGNWMPNENTSKIHSFLLENADGKLYFSSYEYRPRNAPDFFLRGSHLYTLDIETDVITDHSKNQKNTMLRDFSVVANTGELTDSSSLLIQYWGIKGIALNPNKPNLIYGITYATDTPGHIIKYDLLDGSIERITDADLGVGETLNYVTVVDNNGNLFYLLPESGYYYLYKYNPTTKTTTRLQRLLSTSSNYNRFSIISPSRDKDVVYCLTFGGHLYKLTCSQDKIEDYGRLTGSFTDRIVNLALNPDETALYYVDIGHSGSQKWVYRYDLQTRQAQRVLDVYPQVGGRILGFSGVNLWDKQGCFYLPVWEWHSDGNADTGLALLQVQTDEDTSGDTPNRPPTLDPVEDQTVAAGNTLTINLSASDPDDNTADLRFSMTNAPAGAGLTAETGRFTWRPSSQQINQSFHPVFTVTDPDNATDSIRVNITVTDPTPPDTVAPSVPANVQATALSPYAVRLTWNDSQDNAGGSGLAGYRVYDGNNVLLTQTATPGFTAAGLTPETTYVFRVSAYDQRDNESQKSLAASAMTLPLNEQDTQAPTVPGSVTAVANGRHRIALAWQPAQDNVAVAGYRIFCNDQELATTPDLYYIHKDLDAGTTYRYQVAAYDTSANQGEKSESISATTEKEDSTDVNCFIRSLRTDQKE